MKRTDDTLFFHDNLDTNFDLENIENPKTAKKKYLKYSIIISLVVLLITTVFLVGYFKFNWFKSESHESHESYEYDEYHESDESDEYDIDIKIQSFSNQVNYFTENKTVTSKIEYSSGEVDKKEQLINTNFIVILTDRNKIKSKQKKIKVDFINNATLVILDSKVKIENEETELNSFNIFDSNKVSEFESNPNGTKYPMAKFSYFENGTLIETELPDDMDKYNAQVILELIDNVIPKLSRSKKKDKKHGINVKTKKTKKGYVLTEDQATQEYSDKFTKKKFKGSKYKKKVIRDIEDEKLKKIKTSTNLVLETQKEDEQTFDFGLKNFTFDVSSEIVSTKNEEKKDEAKLINKLSRKLKFIKSDDLMELIIAKEQKEVNAEKVNNEVQQNEEDSGPIVLEKDSNSKQLRKLGIWEGSFSYSWTLATTNILGETVSLQYEISLSGGSLKNTVSLSCGSITILLGNKGTSSNKIQPITKTGDRTLFKIPFPGTPIPVQFAFKLSGSIGYSVTYTISTKTFEVTFKGSLSAKTELAAGIEGVAEISVGAEGTILSITTTSSITKKIRYIGSNTIKVSGGEISCYVSGKLLSLEVFNISKKFAEGWSKTLK